MSEQRSVVERIDIETAPFAKRFRFSSGFPFPGIPPTVVREIVETHGKIMRSFARPRRDKRI